MCNAAHTRVVDMEADQLVCYVYKAYGIFHNMNLMLLHP